jgi:5-formyltetrahydrofolate cyclo-ligase
MRKLILVFYINIGGLTRQRADQYIHELVELYQSQHEENDILTYWFPIQNGENRIECINPERLNNDEYDLVLERIQNIENQFNENMRCYNYRHTMSEFEETNYEEWKEE